MIAKTPKPPYYAVIFCSIKTEDDDGYTEMTNLMVELANQQDGFLGMESARNEIGITISYWRDIESIKKWKKHSDHLKAQKKGKSDWYKKYKVSLKIKRTHNIRYDRIYTRSS